MMKAIPVVAAVGRPQPARQGVRRSVGEGQLCERESHYDSTPKSYRMKPSSKDNGFPLREHAHVVRRA